MKKVVQPAEQSARDSDVQGTKVEGGMFTIEATQDRAGRVIVMGRPSRKHADTFVNIPISGELRDQLGDQILGSLAMGTGALVEWALRELQRQGISIKVRPRN